MNASMSHWPVVKLGDVADTALGKMLDRGKSRSLPQVRYLRNVNVQWGRIDTHDLLTMEMSDEDRRRFAVESGDLLVCEGGEIGRAAIWHGQSEYMAYQKALHRIRSRGSLDLTFLRYLLELYHENGVLASFSTGSTIAHLSQQKLRSLPVPLPDVSEQQRIVEILEAHLSRLDVAEALLDRSISSAKAHVTSHTDKVLYSERWPAVAIGSLLKGPMRNGISATSVSGPSGVRTLTLTAVTKDDFSDKNTKLTSAEPARVRDLWLEPGDILVQRSNTPQLVGTSALFNGPAGWAIFPDLMIRIRADGAQVTSEYLAVALRAERTHRALRRRAKGLAGSMPKIDHRALAETVIPLAPTLEIQTEAVERIRRQKMLLDRLSAEFGSAQARAGALRRALLGAAFSGRLTGRSADIDAIEEMAGV